MGRLLSQLTFSRKGSHTSQSWFENYPELTKEGRCLLGLYKSKISGDFKILWSLRFSVWLRHDSFKHTIYDVKKLESEFALKGVWDSTRAIKRTENENTENQWWPESDKEKILLTRAQAKWDNSSCSHNVNCEPGTILRT